MNKSGGPFRKMRRKIDSYEIVRKLTFCSPGNQIVQKDGPTTLRIRMT